MSQSVTIHGPNIAFAHGATFEVHAAGCRDGARIAAKHGTEPAFEVASRTEVCDDVYPPEDFGCESGEYLGEFHFAPCVHLPVNA